MTALFDQVVSLLKDSDYDFQVSDEDEVLRLLIEAEPPAGSWVAYLRVMDNDICVVYSQLELDVPPEHRETMSAFITRVNFGILLGNFELDLEDGECRFKTAFDSDGAEVPPAVIVNTIDGNLAKMHEYLPALRGIAMGEMTLDEALEACGRTAQAG